MKPEVAWQNIMTNKTTINIKDITSKVEKNEEQANQTIIASVPFDKLTPYRDEAFAELAKHFQADGFRPGKVPSDLLKKQIPEIAVLERAGRNLISDNYIALLEKHDIDGIGQPQIQITKLAADNPFEFSITLANVPTVTLGDYQKITKSVDKKTIDPEVTKTELDQAIEALRHQWAQQEAYQATMNDESIDQAEKAKIDPRQIKITDTDLPEVNDAWVKQLGEYESVNDFRDKFKANIKTNKAMEELDKRRAETLGTVVEQSTFSVPEIVYESELERLIELRKAEIKQAGLKYHDYLKTLKKTEEDLKADMRDSAVNRVHQQMVIAEIARDENLLPDKSDVDKEVEYLAKMYPEADKANLTAYVQSQLTTQSVLQFLVSPVSDKADAKKKSVSKPKKSTGKKTDTKAKKTGKKPAKKNDE